MSSSRHVCRYFKWIWIIYGLFFSIFSYGWQHGISLGYGSSKEVGYSYHTSGIYVQGIVHQYKKIDPMLYFSVGASLGSFHTNTVKNHYLTTIAVSGALRAYFYPPLQQRFVPYLLATFGPTYLSTKRFGAQSQGAHLSFQTTLGAGVEMARHQGHAWDINLRMIHYCNAGIFSPNEGFDIFYTLSLGYLF